MSFDEFSEENPMFGQTFLCSLVASRRNAVANLHPQHNFDRKSCEIAKVDFRAVLLRKKKRER